MKRKLLIILVTGVLLAIGQLVVPEASAHQIVAGSGTWSPTGSMSIVHGYQTATLLHNGKVLVVGGYDSNSNALALAELYNPRTGIWSPTGSLLIAREGQIATLLLDGKVLVVGGYDSRGNSLTSAELYNPHTGMWSLTGNLLSNDDVLSATLLHNGNVLVTTGIYYGVSPIKAELYNPHTGTWSPTGNLLSNEVNAETATLLHNGNVLVTISYETLSLQAKLYNPRTGTWSPTGGSLAACLRSTATLLRNGKVLLICYEWSRSTIELYDPGTGTWSQTGDLSTPRAYAEPATLLPNGKVLLAGGGSNYYHSSPISNAEVYNPYTGKWSPTASMLIPHWGNTATLLPNGKVLIAGGDTSNVLGRDIPTSEAELYTPAC